MRGIVGSVVVGVLGLIAGLLIGQELGLRQGDAAVAGTEVASAPAPEPAAIAPAPGPEVREEVTTESPVAPEADELIGPRLISYAEEGIRSGWNRSRDDEIDAEHVAEGLALFRRVVMESPVGIGMQLGKDQTAREKALEDARSGGVFALLATLEQGDTGPLPDLVRDDALFLPLFQRVAPERPVSAGTLASRPDDATEDGSTLIYPAGVFRVGDIMGNKRPYPRDVTVAGAGMDATLLVLRSDLYTRDHLRNFMLRDCTVFTDNNYLLGLRHPGTVQLERVRVMGFDMGAGASCAFGTDEFALHARDSIITGGYGRHPAHGRLFDTRTNALLARFDRCTVERVHLGLNHICDRATVVFSACVLKDILDDYERYVGAKPGVVFDGCVFQETGLTDMDQQLDLNALFPDWQKRVR